MSVNGVAALHTDWLAGEIVPPTALVTVMMTVFELTDVQTPLLTTARKYLVEANGPMVAPVSVAVVAPGIFVQAVLSGDDCHWMDPVEPASVRLAGVLPGQIV